MTNIVNREVKRFHDNKTQISFGYGSDGTLLVQVNTPNGTWVSLILDQWQTQEHAKWLNEQTGGATPNTK